MLSVEEAFVKFRGRQELTKREQSDVSKRHTEVRDSLKTEVKLQRDFLTGSYARWTKTRPLRDVDVFCVLDTDEEGYRRRPPIEILTRFRNVLSRSYDNVSIDRMAVVVDFGVSVDSNDESDDKVLSIEAVPAFVNGDHFDIPDSDTNSWIETNPDIHFNLAVSAHQAMQNEWKPLVRMIKKWNRQLQIPIEPSFLLEVFALKLLRPPFSGGYPYELKAFFASAAERVYEAWPDPAGLGPDVNGTMTTMRRALARDAFAKAEQDITNCLYLAKAGRNGEALQAWRKFFGPQFPLS